MLSIHAQDNRFEYADSSLLKDIPAAGEEENTSTTENAAEEEKDILSDTTVYINKVSISPDSIAAWKNNKRFAYMKNIDSLLKLKQLEEQAAQVESQKTKPNSFLSKLFASGILQIFFWAIAITFVCFILYKLFLSNGIFKRNTVSAKKTEDEPAEESIATVADYDKLIHQSIKLGDHRMAVRYLFLKTLVHLTEKEYLHYSSDKTNYQYVHEIRADRKQEFASLVLNYEYIWYGNFPLNAELYKDVEKKFSTFYNKIL